MAMMEVNKDDFEKEVIQCEKAVLVDFNANWCGPCKMLKPILDEIEKESDEVKFVSVNIDNEEELADEYQVFSIPCLILFRDGKEIKRSVGLVSRDDILKLIGGL